MNSIWQILDRIRKYKSTHKFTWFGSMEPTFTESNQYCCLLISEQEFYKGNENQKKFWKTDQFFYHLTLHIYTSWFNNLYNVPVECTSPNHLLIGNIIQVRALLPNQVWASARTWIVLGLSQGISWIILSSHLLNLNVTFSNDFFDECALMSMCFDLSWYTEFLMRCMELWLSQYNVNFSWFKLNSFSNQWSQIPSFMASVAAIYFTSVVDKATTFCKHEFQLMAPP